MRVDGWNAVMITRRWIFNVSGVMAYAEPDDLHVDLEPPLGWQFGDSTASGYCMRHENSDPGSEDKKDCLRPISKRSERGLHMSAFPLHLNHKPCGHDST